MKNALIHIASAASIIILLPAIYALRALAKRGIFIGPAKRAHDRRAREIQLALDAQHGTEIAEIYWPAINE